jgi:hypothetical protein
MLFQSQASLILPTQLPLLTTELLLAPVALVVTVEGLYPLRVLLLTEFRGGLVVLRYLLLYLSS